MASQTCTQTGHGSCKHQDRSHVILHAFVVVCCFFQNQLFQKIWNIIRVSNSFGSRSEPTFCLSSSWSKLFAKVIHSRQNPLLARKGSKTYHKGISNTEPYKSRIRMASQTCTQTGHGSCKHQDRSHVILHAFVVVCFFFQNQLFQKIWNIIRVSNSFGSRSEPTFCRS